MHFIEYIRRRYSQLKVDLAIKKKWQHDCSLLPLTKAHRELYEIIHRLCWQELGKLPNLVNCYDFNDRIQWLKLFDQDRKIIRCSDKIQIRDYIQERIGDKYLVKLYQTHDHFDQIDFDSLPDSFVIKTNHDSGSVILVNDKKRWDRKAAKKRIETALSKPYGWSNGEWAYSFVKPRILVEELINFQNPKPPPDYKFYCINGKVKFCHYIYDRGFGTKEQTIDSAGNDLATELYPSFTLGKGFSKPLKWGKMIWIAEQLSADFKCVRVDLFCTLERIYAGEMTFWPMAGCYKGDGQKKLGQLLDFDRTTVKPFLLAKLERERNWHFLYTATES